MPDFYRLMGVDTPFDVDRRFFSSWLLPPYFLGTVRALLSLYAFVVMFVIFGIYDSRGEWAKSSNTFSYFTDLTYWGLAFYNGVAAFHTFTYASKGWTYLDKWPRTLQALHSLFYTTVIVFPWIVTIVYWGVLNDGLSTTFQYWSNISQHALNSVYALLEIVLTRTNPPPMLHLLCLAILLALYLALAYITYATKHFYVYSFLDPSEGSGHLAGYIIGILVACIVVFFVVSGLIRLRKYLTERVGGYKGRMTEKQSILDLEVARRVLRV